MIYFIIIRGPLGSGKSTISKKLASILDAELIGMDEVLEEHGLDKMPPDAPCIPAENFIKANEIVLPNVKRLLKNDKIVIFDACFYHKEVIDHLIKNLPFDHYVFTLKAPLELCIQRDSKRSKTHGEGAACAVHSLVSRFDHGHIIDVDNTLKETIKDIMTYLPKARTIRLRKLKKGDLGHFLKWWKDKEIIALTSGTDEESDAVLKGNFLNFFKNEKNHHFMIMFGKEAIGHIALIHTNAKTCEIQIVIGEKQYWGKGLGTAALKKALSLAFSKFGYSKATLEVRPENIRAIKTYESCGFMRNGLKKYPKNKHQPVTLKMSISKT